MKQEVEGHKINPTLDEKKGQDVLFGSFYFSQGNVDFQHDIFSYLHRIRPNWYMDHDAFPRQLIRDQKFKKRYITSYYQTAKNIHHTPLQDG